MGGRELLVLWSRDFAGTAAADLADTLSSTTSGLDDLKLTMQWKALCLSRLKAGSSGDDETVMDVCSA